MISSLKSNNYLIINLGTGVKKIVSEEMSGRPGSNRRHSAWKADALPTELLPHWLKDIKIFTIVLRNENPISKNRDCSKTYEKQYFEHTHLTPLLRNPLLWRVLL